MILFCDENCLFIARAKPGETEPVNEFETYLVEFSERRPRRPAASEDLFTRRSGAGGAWAVGGQTVRDVWHTPRSGARAVFRAAGSP